MKQITTKTTKKELIEMVNELSMEIDGLEEKLEDKCGAIELYESQVHNLTLYLDFVRQTDKKTWEALKKTFKGLPGWSNKTVKYVAPKAETPKKPAKK